MHLTKEENRTHNDAYNFDFGKQNFGQSCENQATVFGKPRPRTCHELADGGGARGDVSF